MNCAEIELNIAKVMERRRFTSEDILKSVCEVSGIDLVTLCSPKRDRDLAEYRFISYALLRSYTPLVLKKIGYMFSRDHSTVLYGIDTHNDLFDTEPVYKQRFEQVVNHMYGREWQRVERPKKIKPEVKPQPTIRGIKTIHLPNAEHTEKQYRTQRAISSVSIPKHLFNFNKYAS